MNVAILYVLAVFKFKYKGVKKIQIININVQKISKSFIFNYIFRELIEVFNMNLFNFPKN